MLDLLARVCSNCTLRWDEPTADDVARLPNNIEATIVGEEVNPTTLLLACTQTKPQMQRPGHTGRKALAKKKKTTLLLAYICAALDSVPELQWVQAPDKLSVWKLWAPWALKCLTQCCQ